MSSKPTGIVAWNILFQNNDSRKKRYFNCAFEVNIHGRQMWYHAVCSKK